MNIGFDDAEFQKEWYRKGLRENGANAKGVTWGSEESQLENFRVLVDGLIEEYPHVSASVLDWGCGVGDLFGYLDLKFSNMFYDGYDVLEDMIAAAREKYPNPNARFFSEVNELKGEYDYVFLSGAFNLVEPDSYTLQKWSSSVMTTLDLMWDRTGIGMAFNMLTDIHDWHNHAMAYGDPVFWTQYCLHRFSRRVMLRHDAMNHSFAVIVRR